MKLLHTLMIVFVLLSLLFAGSTRVNLFMNESTPTPSEVSSSPVVNQVNMKSAYIILTDERGYTVRIDKNALREVDVTTESIELTCDNRNFYRLIFRDRTRHRIEYQNIINWWKAGN